MLPVGVERMCHQAVICPLCIAICVCLILFFIGSWASDISAFKITWPGFFPFYLWKGINSFALVFLLSRGPHHPFSVPPHTLLMQEKWSFMLAFGGFFSLKIAGFVEVTSYRQVNLTKHLLSPFFPSRKTNQFIKH